MTFSITTLIVLVAAIAPHAITPTAQIETIPAVTPAAQNFPDDGVINQINTLTEAATLTSTPKSIPTPGPTPRKRGSGSRNRAVSGDTPEINIDQNDNKISYHDFNKGDPWNITMLNIATNGLSYKFNDTIGEPDTPENNWVVWLGNISRDEQHGIQKCIFPGNYSIYTNASHNGIIIEKNGQITVNSLEACRFPPVPAPELNPIILILTGLLGILFISRKQRRNFS